MARSWLALLPLLLVLGTGCLGKRFVLSPADLYPAESIIINDYQPRDVSIPRGFEYLPKESFSYVGSFRVVDLHYNGETLVEDVAEFFEDQMPRHGWQYYRREGVTNLTLVFVNGRDECYLTLRRIENRTELNLRIQPRDVKPHKI